MLFAAFVLILASRAQLGAAELRLAGIFGDHMVLQQGSLMPIWGTASPGESISVAAGNRQGKTTADENGRWMVKLDPLTVSSAAVEVRVTGTNTITLHDVLVGDVWLCSGQSNMEFGITMARNGHAAVATANHSLLRLFLINRNSSLTPQQDVKGTWVVCMPQSVAKGGWNGFSAVAYFFGKEIQEEVHIPIGLIGCYYGGTPAQAWTSMEALTADPSLAHFAADFEQLRANLPAAEKQFHEQTLPQWHAAHDAWEKQLSDADKAQLAAWRQIAAEASKKGALPPPAPGIAGEPKRPFDPQSNPRIGCVLYNAMVYPLIPLALKGVIWYQGEQNAASKADAIEYARLFPAMIADWRRRWSKGDPSLANFPFIFVQLAGWGPGTFFPYRRDSQLKALAVPNTAMAVALDVGDEHEVHYKDKEPVGHRLALAARHLAYGEDIPYSGPIYQSMAVAGNKIRLTFSHVDGGLTAGMSPAQEELHGFTIAAEGSSNFVPAKAVIDGDSVVVSSDQISHPGAVRYGWDAFPKPMANLYNKAALPASPFATSIGDDGREPTGQAAVPLPPH